MNEKALQRTALRDMSMKAAKYAFDNDVGVRAALKTGMFQPATRNSTQPLLRKMKDQNKAIDERLRDHAKQILTNIFQMLASKAYRRAAEGGPTAGLQTFPGAS